MAWHGMAWHGGDSGRSLLAAPLIGSCLVPPRAPPLLCPRHTHRPLHLHTVQHLASNLHTRPGRRPHLRIPVPAPRLLRCRLHHCGEALFIDHAYYSTISTVVMSLTCQHSMGCAGAWAAWHCSGHHGRQQRQPPPRCLLMPRS